MFQLPQISKIKKNPIKENFIKAMKKKRKGNESKVT